MKKLICVWGSADYGKSSAIKEFDKIIFDVVSDFMSGNL